MVRTMSHVRAGSLEEDPAPFPDFGTFPPHGNPKIPKIMVQTMLRHARISGR
jgi:hypothetical protein